MFQVVDISMLTVLNQWLITESLLLSAWLVSAEFRVTVGLEMMVEVCVSCDSTWHLLKGPLNVDCVLIFTDRNYCEVVIDSARYHIL
jgi:hypothetical protein